MLPIDVNDKHIDFLAGSSDIVQFLYENLISEDSSEFRKLRRKRFDDVISRIARLEIEKECGNKKKISIPLKGSSNISKDKVEFADESIDQNECAWSKDYTESNKDTVFIPTFQLTEGEHKQVAVFDKQITDLEKEVHDLCVDMAVTKLDIHNTVTKYENIEVKHKAHIFSKENDICEIENNLRDHMEKEVNPRRAVLNCADAIRSVGRIAESSYIVHLEAQYMNVLHGIGLTENQYQQLNHNVIALAKSTRRDVISLREENSEVELKLINQLSKAESQLDDVSNKFKRKISTQEVTIKNLQGENRNSDLGRPSLLV